MNLHQILIRDYLIFGDEETDILIAWNGVDTFNIFSGKFNGDYDNIDGFYRKVKTIEAAKEVARIWFQEHATFNPGP